MVILASLLALAPLPAANTCATSLESARQAYGTYDVPAARRSYAAVLAAGCQRNQVAEADTELARIAWLVDGNAQDAVRLLGDAMALVPDPCPSARLLGRILNSTGQSQRASIDLEQPAKRCAAIEPGVALERISALVELAERAPAARRSALVAAVRRAMDDAPALARASLQGARLRLAIGLLGLDPEEALDGWRGFYWLTNKSKPQGFSQSDAEIRQTFSRGLVAGAAVEARIALVNLLIRGGFYEEAERLAGAGPASGDPRWRTARAYFDMRRNVTALLLRHDRAMAAKTGAAKDALEGELMRVLREGIAAAGRPGDDPWPALRELWGLVGTTGQSNGVSGLHLGHVSIDLAQPIRQRSRSGEVRFVALDNMIANGFSGWLGDGVTGPGGWAADGRIIQVRTRYVQSALDRAAIAFPGPARDAFLSKLDAEEREDLGREAGGEIVFLPGLADRLRLAAVDELADELRRQNVAPAAIEERFARLWYDRSFEGTILLHEGRHALDQVEYPVEKALSDGELEYRAKLSELEFSTSPRIMLASIYGRLIGGTTGHGIANARLLKALVVELLRQSSAIREYDPAKPALAQLWRLDTAHLRDAATRLDPEQ